MSPRNAAATSINVRSFAISTSANESWRESAAQLHHTWRWKLIKGKPNHEPSQCYPPLRGGPALIAKAQNRTNGAPC